LQKKILLVNYSFPPFSGVGGRRWAKLAKYMAQDGIQVFVVNAMNSSLNNSSWIYDVIDSNIKVFPVHNLSKETSNLIFRKWRFFLSKHRTNANYADQSLWWNENAYLRAVDIIKENSINHVVVSCPPYHLMYQFLSLKKEFSNIKITADYRDMWIEMQNGKGFFNHLSDKRFLAEKEMELKVVKDVDTIVTVSEEMTNAYDIISGKKNCFTIPNGFDNDDFNTELSSDFVSQFIYENKVNIVFAGSLVTDSNAYAIPFFEAIAKLKVRSEKEYHLLNIQVFGNLNDEINSIVNHHNLTIVRINKPIASSKICSLFKYFDYLLLFLIPYYRFAYISKFFDYLPARKPIIAVTEDGTFSEYLINNKLGLQIRPDECEVKITEFIKNKVDVNLEFDIQIFDYKVLAANYKNIIFS
jgi:glycosyltransferase involved in cell wall biosynthesis